VRAFFLPVPGRALADAAGDVGARRVHIHRAVAGIHHEIHVFHGDGAEQYLVAQYQRADKARAVLEAQDQRSDVGVTLPRSVGERHLAVLMRIQLELQADMFGDAEEH